MDPLYNKLSFKTLKQIITIAIPDRLFPLTLKLFKAVKLLPKLGGIVPSHKYHINCENDTKIGNTSTY